MADSKLSKAQLMDALRSSQTQIAALQAEVSAQAMELKTVADELIKTQDSFVKETAKLQESEKQLHDQQAQYQAFLDHSVEGVWRLDCTPPVPTTLSTEEQIELIYAGGYMGECNPAMAKMYGFPGTEELLGTRLGDLLVRDDPQNLAMLRAFIESDYRLSDYESHEIDREGNPKYFLNNFSGIIKDHEFHGCWGTQRDITESKKLALELSTQNRSLAKEVEERKQIGYELLKAQLNIQTLLDALPDLLFRINRDGTYLAFKAPRDNSIFDEPADIVGKNLEEILPDELARKAQVYIEQTLATGEMQKFDYELTMNGKTRWYEARLVVSGADEVTAIVRDITEARLVDQALRESEERFSKAFHFSPLALSILSMKDFSHLYMNAIALQELGYKEAEVIGRTPDDLSMWADEKERRDIYKLFTTNPSIRDYEIQIRRKNGEIGVVLLDCEPITINGDPCLLVTGNDITKRVKAERALRESEERFQSLAKSSPVGIYRLDKQGKCVYINARWSEIVGFGAEAVYGYGWINAIHPEDREHLLTLARELSAQGSDFRAEYRFQRPDGTSAWVYGQAVPERDASGELIGYVGTLTDITERVKSEQALRESEERFHNLARSSPVGIFRCKRDGQFVYVNERWSEIVGVGREQALGFGWVKTLHSDDREKVLKVGIEAAKTCSDINVEYRVKRPDGTIVWIYGQSIAEFNNAGEFISYIGTLTDITERKQAEEALRESEAKFRVIAESSVGVVMLYDKESFIYVNPAIEAVTGYSRQELLHMSPWDIIHPSYNDYANQRWQERIDGRSVVNNSEYRILTKSGEERWVEFTAGDFIHYQGKSVATATAFDITERKRAEDLLAAEKERLAVTLRSIGDGVIATDTEEKVVLLNRVAEKLTGWSQEAAIGKPLSDVFQIINETTREACPSPVKRAMQSGQVIGLSSPTLLISKSGKEYPIADSGAPIRDQNSKIIGVVLVFRDTSGERQREEELLKASKLESIGILAGGIAHDFNNILTAISGNISLARRFIEPQNKAYKRLNETEAAVFRAKDLTQQLLTFARGGAPIKRTSAIAPLLEETVNFALSGSNIESKISSPDDLWLVEIDEGQISQVIHNLVLNARQAMPLGGKLEAAAQNVYVDSRTVIQGIQLRPGRYIKILVMDEGVGIAEEYLSKIFDPYFTTKQRGSGLGLATAYSIIKKHDGYIFVESELRSGATFSVYLRASDKSLIRPPQSSPSVLSGKGRILAMDDEEAIRNMLDDMLSYLGYEFVGAASGEEAVELYRKAYESGLPFDTVLMDLTVPGRMGGQEAVKQILGIDPQARCIVSSGYSTAPVMAEYKKYGFVAVIAKPFQITDLSDVLQAVLGQQSSGFDKPES
jgi:PAS domain S-box-containing protein